MSCVGYKCKDQSQQQPKAREPRQEAHSDGAMGMQSAGGGGNAYVQKLIEQRDASGGKGKEGGPQVMVDDPNNEAVIGHAQGSTAQAAKKATVGAAFHMALGKGEHQALESVPYDPSYSRKLATEHYPDSSAWAKAQAEGVGSWTTGASETLKRDWSSMSEHFKTAATRAGKEADDTQVLDTEFNKWTALANGANTSYLRAILLGEDLGYFDPETQALSVPYLLDEDIKAAQSAAEKTNIPSPQASLALDEKVMAYQKAIHELQEALAGFRIQQGRLEMSKLEEEAAELGSQKASVESRIAAWKTAGGLLDGGLGLLTGQLAGNSSLDEWRDSVLGPKGSGGLPGVDVSTDGIEITELHRARDTMSSLTDAGVFESVLGYMGEVVNEDDLRAIDENLSQVSLAHHTLKELEAYNFDIAVMEGLKAAVKGIKVAGGGLESAVIDQRNQFLNLGKALDGAIASGPAGEQDKAQPQTEHFAPILTMQQALVEATTLGKSANDQASGFPERAAGILTRCGQTRRYRGGLYPTYTAKGSGRFNTYWKDEHKALGSIQEQTSGFRSAWTEQLPDLEDNAKSIKKDMDRIQPSLGKAL